MTTKSIPYEQALKLVIWMNNFKELNGVVQDANTRLDTLRKKLLAAADFTSIPLHSSDLNVKIENGPDEDGLITVEWEG